MAVKKSQSAFVDASDNASMKQIMIAGPLLGSRQRNIASDFISWDRFEPIITPEISSKQKGEDPQRFILLPHSHHISVLAYQTGTKIATLVIFDDDSEARQFSDQVLIETVSLSNYKRKLSDRTVEDVLRMDEDGDSDDEGDAAHRMLDQIVDEVVVLAGCRDGSIREFSLQELKDESATTSSASCGSYHVLGSCYRPRRVIQVTKKDPIMHLTTPQLRSIIHKDGILTYATIRTKDLDVSYPDSEIESLERLNVTVLRLVLPFFDGKTKVSLVRKEEGEIQRKWQMDHFRCRVGKDKVGGFINSTPFRVTAVARSGVDECSVFLVIGRADRVIVYYDRAVERQALPGMEFHVPNENPLSSLQVSTNNNDIACGHYFGQIRILNGILSDVEKYHRAMAKAQQHFGQNIPSSNRPPDPRSNLITSKAHWHAHPVASLVYDALSSPVDPMLYSGGAESVLVTWQMTQGRSKPLHFLPRVSLGSIIHVVSSDRADSRPANGVLVYSDDNSLALFESHGKGKLWELKGLTCGFNEDTNPRLQRTTIEVDPRSRGALDAKLVVTGLPEAPGLMYWYDTYKCKIAASLEITPFNRVSKTETEDEPMPVPSITNHAFCNHGKELITVDVTATENLFVGAFDDYSKKEAYGIVTTIRFWEWNKDAGQNNPYSLTAAMSFPHGPKNRVSALGASKDGMMACTVSNDEKAFRLWKKVVPEDREETKRRPAWTCRCKVTIPAGFSNFGTLRDGVAFSDDGSTLALSCGNMVTFWDAAEARFLTSLRHLEGAAGTIEKIEFISCGLLKDVLLMKSDLGVSLQSPFGPRSGFKGWSWGIPPGLDSVRVTAAEFLPSHVCVAIAMFHSARGRSRLTLINAISGKPELHGTVPAIHDDVEGCIISMSAAGRAQKINNWDSAEPISDEISMHLYGMVDNGNLTLFTGADTNPVSSTDVWEKKEIERGPTLSINNGRNAKRVREDEQLQISQMDPITKRSAIDIFGLVSKDDTKAAAPSTSELPSLSRNFVRSFVGRRLVQGAGKGSEE